MTRVGYSPRKSRNEDDSVIPLRRQIILVCRFVGNRDVRGRVLHPYLLNSSRARPVTRLSAMSKKLYRFSCRLWCHCELCCCSSKNSCNVLLRHISSTRSFVRGMGLTGRLSRMLSSSRFVTICRSEVSQMPPRDSHATV